VSLYYKRATGHARELSRDGCRRARLNSPPPHRHPEQDSAAPVKHLTTTARPAPRPSLQMRGAAHREQRPSRAGVRRAWCGRQGACWGKRARATTRAVAPTPPREETRRACEHGWRAPPRKNACMRDAYRRRPRRPPFLRVQSVGIGVTSSMRPILSPERASARSAAWCGAWGLQGYLT